MRKPLVGNVLGAVLLLAAWNGPSAIATESGKTRIPDTLGPPLADGTVEVSAAFHLQDINEIDEEKEIVEFTGVLTLKWLDKRQAFDPVEAGVQEKVYQGTFQFNEISPAWYPQVILKNVSELYETSAVVLLVEPDGSSTLIQTVNAIAEVDLDLRRTPFDSQRLEAVFELFGVDTKDVMLVEDPIPKEGQALKITIPQWTLIGLEQSIRTSEATYLGKQRTSSALVLAVNMQRQPFFLVRLVIMPLTLIVILSWSVFWMDRSSLGDRMSVSFVGILTAVTYQIVLGAIMPHISYLTLMNGFLNISFLFMCLTVVVNLIVGAADKKGYYKLGDRIDRCSRISFPLFYFGAMTAAGVAAFFVGS